MTKVNELHERWLKKPGYKAAYDELEEEFQFARAMIEARTRADLSQAEVAVRMKTSQSYVARIESGAVRPSTAALARFANATGTKLKIAFEPTDAKSKTPARKPTPVLHHHVAAAGLSRSIAKKASYGAGRRMKARSKKK